MFVWCLGRRWTPYGERSWTTSTRPRRRTTTPSRRCTLPEGGRNRPKNWIEEIREKRKSREGERFRASRADSRLRLAQTCSLDHRRSVPQRPQRHGLNTHRTRHMLNSSRTTFLARRCCPFGQSRWSTKLPARLGLVISCDPSPRKRFADWQVVRDIDKRATQTLKAKSESSRGSTS